MRIRWAVAYWNNISQKKSSLCKHASIIANVDLKLELWIIPISTRSFRSYFIGSCTLITRIFEFCQYSQGLCEVIEYFCINPAVNPQLKPIQKEFTPRKNCCCLSFWMINANAYNAKKKISCQLTRWDGDELMPLLRKRITFGFQNFHTFFVHFICK